MRKSPRLASYSRHVYEIASNTNAEVVKAAEAQLAEVQAKFASVVENAAKNAATILNGTVSFIRPLYDWPG